MSLHRAQDEHMVERLQVEAEGGPRVTKRWRDLSPLDLVLGDEGGLVEWVHPSGVVMLSDEHNRWNTRKQYRDLDEVVELGSAW